MNQAPTLIAVAGPNGAGKTTFYRAHLAPAGLRYVSADVLAAALQLEGYAAARMADDLRRALLAQRASFVFETVFSDPAGDKLAFLRDAVAAGYEVILCFIAVASPEASEARVCMRVSQGGHDVPADKLRPRFTRTFANLRAAIRQLPRVIVYDNSDLAAPFQRVAEYRDGRALETERPCPSWLAELMRAG